MLLIFLWFSSILNNMLKELYIKGGIGLTIDLNGFEGKREREKLYKLYVLYFFIVNHYIQFVQNVNKK